MGTKLLAILRVCLLLAAAVPLAGCASARLAGAYYGERGPLGQQVLYVQRDGAITDEYGMPDRGTWQYLGNNIIEARFHLLGGGSARRYYRLNPAARTFDWATDLDTLVRRSGGDREANSE